MKKLEKRNQLRPWVSTDRFMKALFINPDQVDDKVKLMDELHTVASDMRDVGLDLNLYDLFYG